MGVYSGEEGGEEKGTEICSDAQRLKSELELAAYF